MSGGFTRKQERVDTTKKAKKKKRKEKRGGYHGLARTAKTLHCYIVIKHTNTYAFEKKKRRHSCIERFSFSLSLPLSLLFFFVCVCVFVLQRRAKMTAV